MQIRCSRVGALVLTCEGMIGLETETRLADRQGRLPGQLENCADILIEPFD